MKTASSEDARRREEGGEKRRGEAIGKEGATHK